MRGMKGTCLLVLVASLTMSGVAFAKGGDSGDKSGVVKPTVGEPASASSTQESHRYIDLGLTGKQGEVRGGYELWFEDNPRPGSNLDAGMQLGGSVTIIKNLDVGIGGVRVGLPIERNSGLMAIQFAKPAGWGDFDFWARYTVFKNDKFEIAPDVRLRAGTNTYFRGGMEFGGTVRARLVKNLVLDYGLQFKILKYGFHSNRASFFASARSFHSPGANYDITIPVQALYSITDRIFIGGRIGLGFVGLGQDAHVIIPLAVRGGYSIPIDKAKINAIHVYSELGTDTFIASNVSGSAVKANYWHITFGALVKTDSLFSFGKNK